MYGPGGFTSIPAPPGPAATAPSPSGRPSPARPALPGDNPPRRGAGHPPSDPPLSHAEGNPVNSMSLVLPRRDTPQRAAAIALPLATAPPEIELVAIQRPGGGTQRSKPPGTWPGPLAKQIIQAIRADL